MDERNNGDDGLIDKKAVAEKKIDYSELSDEELILSVPEGDNQAFDVLVKRYKNRLYSYLLRLLGNEDQAEEIAQETFVKAYMNAEKYRRIARFSTWLYTIATNLVRNYMRNIKRKPKTVSLWFKERGGERIRWRDIEDESRGPDERMEQKDLEQLLQAAIEKIPHRYRNTFVLREINRLSYEEIAATTGLKIGTVRSRINRGRKYFRKAAIPLLSEDYHIREGEE